MQTGTNPSPKEAKTISRLPDSLEFTFSPTVGSFRSLVSPTVPNPVYSPSRIDNSPSREPFQVSPLSIVALHTEHNGPKQPEETDNGRIEYGVDAPLYPSIQLLRHPIHTEASGQDSEVQCGIVMMDVGDTRHGDERKIVQEPADDWVEAGVVDVVNVLHTEFAVAALPANQIPQDQ